MYHCDTSSGLGCNPTSASSFNDRHSDSSGSGLIISGISCIHSTPSYVTRGYGAFSVSSTNSCSCSIFQPNCFVGGVSARRFRSISADAGGKSLQTLPTTRERLGKRSIVHNCNSVQSCSSSPGHWRLDSNADACRRSPETIRMDVCHIKFTGDSDTAT